MTRPIRVLRVLEYVYETPEAAEDDMARWTPQVRSNHMTMRSAALPLTVIEWDEWDETRGVGE